MNSLEFIKMHVDEWPVNSRAGFKLVTLLNDGVVYFGFGLIPSHQTLDLSEHFAPDYYDGVMWTREQFEACGSDETVCGKPKADFIKAINRVNELEADEKPTLWSPTINSIVDVGDCEGVVKAIDGEHCWVLKDTSMYGTYHKDSLKNPLSDEEQLYKDVVAALSDAAWITDCESKTAIGRLDKLGYKIVRKED